MIRSSHWFVSFAAALVLFSALPTLATTITVTSTSDSGSGSLRAAIAAAHPGDTINFSLTYPATITLSSALPISTPVTVSGPGASNLVITGGGVVQGNQVGGTIEVSANPVTISGITVDNNVFAFPSHGSRLYNTGNLTITNCVISHGYTSLGGGVYNAGTAVITDSTLTNNQGNDDGFNYGGGGIFNSGTLTLTNSSVSGNIAAPGGPGGGIYNSGGVVTIQGSTISNNQAGSGGGIFSLGDSSNVTVINSTITGNDGLSTTGGLEFGRGTLMVTGSTISVNRSEGQVGGLSADGSSTIINTTIAGNYDLDLTGGATVGGLVSIINSTISGNRSQSGVGGLFVDGAANLLVTNPMTTLKNTIIAENTGWAANCYTTGTMTSDGHNLSDDASCATSFTGPGDLNKTPAGLDPAGLKNNGGPTETVALLSGPAIYSIPLTPVNYCTLTDGVTPVVTDQRGVSRPQSPNGCSIGAFEPIAPSVYAQLQSLYSAIEGQISAWPSGDKDRDDLRQIKNAAEEISEMLNSKNWTDTDGNHLDRDRSFRFFMDDQEAVSDLMRVLHDRDDHHPDTIIPTAAIQADLTALAAANRLLATTAVTGASTKHPDLIERANHKLAEGDAEVADGHFERGIDDYSDAWSLAENAR